MKSLDELIREAEAEAHAMVNGTVEPAFHSATIVSLESGRLIGDFTYQVPTPKQ